MSSCAFLLIDVFTTRPLQGNPLPVILDGSDLSDGQMQAIAREFNASETTFVLPPRDARAARRLRCFSPAAEVFGAGHNALGAWWAVFASGSIALGDGETELFQEIGDRVLPITATSERGRVVRVAMAQPFPRLTPVALDLAETAAALGLDAGALGVRDWSPFLSASAAMHLLVPARDLDTLWAVRVDGPRLAALAKAHGCYGCYLFSLEVRDAGSVAHARAFLPGLGIAEDPATGTAAGPLGAALVARDLARPGAWMTIEQGDAIGRACRIDVRVRDEAIDVAGACVVVGEGTLRV